MSKSSATLTGISVGTRLDQLSASLIGKKSKLLSKRKRKNLNQTIQLHLKTIFGPPLMNKSSENSTGISVGPKLVKLLTKSIGKRSKLLLKRKKKRHLQTICGLPLMNKSLVKSIGISVGTKLVKLLMKLIGKRLKLVFRRTMNLNNQF